MDWLNLPPQIWCWLLQFPCCIPQVDCCGWQQFSLENSIFYWWFCRFSCSGLRVLLLVAGWPCPARFDNFSLFVSVWASSIQKISASRLGHLLHAHLVGWKSLGQTWSLNLRPQPGGFLGQLSHFHLIISHSPLQTGDWKEGSFPPPFPMQIPLPGKMCFNCALDNFETCWLFLAPCQAGAQAAPWPTLGSSPPGHRCCLFPKPCLEPGSGLGCWDSSGWAPRIVQGWWGCSSQGAEMKYLCLALCLCLQKSCSPPGLSLCHGMLHRDWEFVCV